jgi:hypothetical protein
VPIRSVPRSPPRTSSTASRAARAASSAARARGSSAGTGVGQRDALGAAFQQRRGQFAFERLDRGGDPDCTTCRRSAARVKLRSSATATKYAR